MDSDTENNSFEIDQNLVTALHIENTISELHDFSYHINNLFDNYIKSTGAPIGQYINSQNIFEFNLNLLRKYEK